MSVDCLSVFCKKNYITKCYRNVLLLSLLQIMFKGNRNSYDNNVLFSCPLFKANVKNAKQLALVHAL